ncbi:hypothetical protein QOZ23_04590 [Pseudomonas aeruginosa]|uniref:hypothetical protein n=1 Tax=Pseudomonas aeruginosa TaxID=287 RepID=UPI0034578247
MRTGLFFCALLAGLTIPALSYAIATADQGVTKFVTDAQSGTVTFIVDGKPVAQINKDGLYVVGSIAYGGTLTDTGSAYVEKIIAEGSGDAP